MIDINLCNADKILSVFEEIGNFIGSNIDGVGHQVQQVFLSGVYYDWVVAEPTDPWENMPAAVGEVVPARAKIEHVLSLAVVRFKVQAKNHALNEIKLGAPGRIWPKNKIVGSYYFLVLSLSPENSTL